MVNDNGHESANLRVRHEVLYLNNFYSLNKRRTATQALKQISCMVDEKGHESANLHNGHEVLYLNNLAH